MDAGGVYVAPVATVLILLALGLFAWWRIGRRNGGAWITSVERDIARKIKAGRCNCRACRNRTSEPCSDFDEDT